MMKGNKSVIASALYLVGNIFTKAVAFLTIPIFTNLLTTSEYGVVNTYTTWVNIASIVICLSLFNSFRSAYVDKQERFNGYCASVIRLALLLFGVSMLIATIAILGVPGIRSDAWMIYSCLIQAFGTFCVTCMTTKYMLEFRYNRRAFYMIVPNLCCVGLAIVLLLVTDENRYMWRIFAYAFVYAMFAIAILWGMRKEKTDKSDWKYATSYSLPLIFHGLSLVVLSGSDRIMITALVNSSEAGIYSLVYNLGTVATAIATALEGIWLPWFIVKLKEGNLQLINKKVVYLVENVSVVVIGVMLVAPEVLKVMSAPEYWSGTNMIFPVALAAYLMFLYDLAVNIEYQYKQTKKIAANTIMAAGINIVLNLILIPIFGTVAAAYTTVISYMFSLIMHGYYAKKCVPGIFPKKTYLPYLLMVVAVSLLSPFLVPFVWLRWGIAVVLGVGYLYCMFIRKRFIALQIKMR